MRRRWDPGGALFDGEASESFAAATGKDGIVASTGARRLREVWVKLTCSRCPRVASKSIRPFGSVYIWRLLACLTCLIRGSIMP